MYSCSDYDNVPYIDAVAVADENGGVTVFCVNKDITEDFELEIALRCFGELKLKEHLVLHHDDVKAINSEAQPDNVVPFKKTVGGIDDGTARINIPALSWNVIRFEK